MVYEEVGAVLPIADGHIFDLRRISGALAYRLQRFQNDLMSIISVATVLLACVNMVPKGIYGEPAQKQGWWQSRRDQQFKFAYEFGDEKSTFLSQLGELYKT